MTRYIVATRKPWNLAAYYRWAKRLPGHWILVTESDHLEAAVEEFAPRYVFFPHWSERVPGWLLQQTECVCFHMTKLPYGRGGSPLQNLIVRGHRETQLTALRMVETLDAGPVYGQRSLPLVGRAAEIFELAAEQAFELIDWIVANEPEPRPQSGEVTYFSRRRPEDSELPIAADTSLEQLYDHIRMLDAPTYPAAFLQVGRWRIEFSNADLHDRTVCGRFRITMRDETDES
jgi:methionyl-tRNA formyltransferase